MHCLKPVNKRVHYNKFVKTKFVDKNLSVKQVYCVERISYLLISVFDWLSQQWPCTASV